MLESQHHSTPPVMALTPLTALSPLDGRYRSKVCALQDTCSEFGLIKLRLLIEIEWLKALSREPAAIPATTAPMILANSRRSIR